MSQIIPDHVEQLLQHWGEQHRRSEGTDDGHRLVLASALVEMTVDRTRENAIRKLLSRTARARVARRLIVQRMRENGEKGRIPAWAGGDPVRCKETRVGGHSRWVMDPKAEMVERWIAQLWHWDPRAAKCLHAHYRHNMRTGQGARWVAQVTELPVNRNGYIAGLARGRLNIQRRAGESVEIGA
jgi:hypothetical protein